MICISVSVVILPIATFGYFRAAMMADFDWPATALSGAYTAANLIIMLTLPVAGRIADRLGARDVAFFSTILYAAILASLGLIGNSLPLFYFLYSLLAVAGAGMSPITFTRIVALWFDKNRALALGLALTGTGLGLAVLPLITQYFIEAYDWRTAYFALGALVIALAVPSIVLILEEPSDRKAEGGEPKKNEPYRVSQLGKTSREAMGGRAFWQLLSAFVFFGLVVGGVMPNLPLLFGESGLSVMQVAKIQFAMGMASIVGRIIAGMLMDRFHAPFVGAFFGISGAMALATFGGIDAVTPGAIVLAALFGLAVGSSADLMSYLSSRYFGLRSYAEIYGWVLSAYLVGAALAPLIFVYLLDGGTPVGSLIYAGSAGLAISALIVALMGSYPKFKPVPVEQHGG